MNHAFLEDWLYSARTAATTTPSFCDTWGASIKENKSRAASFRLHTNVSKSIHNGAMGISW